MAITTTSQNRSQAEVIELGRLLGLLLDSKWLILSGTTIFAIIGIVYALCATPIYKADALVQVEQKSGGIPGLSDMSDLLGNDNAEAATEIELIKSRMILGQTVDDLKLDMQVQPLFPYGVGKGIAERMGWQAGTLVIGHFRVPSGYDDQVFEFEALGEGRYRLILDDSQLLSGQIGEVSETADGMSILVNDLNAAVGERFSLSHQHRLQVINDLQQAVTVSEKGKKTGMLALSMEGDDPEAIRATLESIARN